MFVLDESIRRSLILVILGLIFIILGGYFGLWQQQVGLRRYAPLTGPAAQVWGGIMCVVGALLIFMALR